MFRVIFETDRKFYNAEVHFKVRGLLKIKLDEFKHSGKVELGLTLNKPSCVPAKVKSTDIMCHKLENFNDEHILEGKSNYINILTLDKSPDDVWEQCFFIMYLPKASNLMGFVGNDLHLTAKFGNKIDGFYEYKTPSFYFTRNCVEACIDKLQVLQNMATNQSVAASTGASFIVVARYNSAKPSLVAEKSRESYVFLEAKLLHDFKEFTLPLQHCSESVLTFVTQTPKTASEQTNSPGYRYRTPKRHASKLKINNDGTSKTSQVVISSALFENLHSETSFRLMLTVSGRKGEAVAPYISEPFSLSPSEVLKSSLEYDCDLDVPNPPEFFSKIFVVKTDNRTSMMEATGFQVRDYNFSSITARSEAMSRESAYIYEVSIANPNAFSNSVAKTSNATRFARCRRFSQLQTRSRQRSGIRRREKKSSCFPTGRGRNPRKRRRER